jgi:subfamily B ATP-binding cassette protein MsbA
VVEETIGGMRLLQGFNATTYANARFGALTQQLRTLNRSTTLRTDLASPTSEFLGSVVIALIIWYGGKMVFGNDNALAAQGAPHLAPHTFITYLVIFSQIMPPAKSVATIYNQIQRGMASVQRIFDVLDTPSAIINNPQILTQASNQALTQTSNQIFEKNICFENVYFNYNNPQQNVLDNISFTLQKGKTLALVGASGSGKSTLIDLLPRFIEPTQGKIKIDGIDLQAHDLTQLRNLFALVPQQSVLFNDTIYNNIVFGLQNTTAEQVHAAAQAAFAHSFIQQLPQQYHTNVGESGNKLSGGQKQRICIARAILRNAPILILDEATSALDTQSEQYIHQALNNYMQNRTCIVVAHRLSTIQAADHIIVMQQGKIAEQGTHTQLMHHTNGLYRQFVALQQV